MSQTFYARVMEFWKWFPVQAPSIAAACHSDDPTSELQQFADSVRHKIGGLAWVFGPGEDADSLSFTVSGEGNKACQLLSQFWLENAVEVSGWSFHASRQPSSRETLDGMSISVGDQEVDMDTLLIGTSIDDENEQVDIEAWHPVFEHIEENDRFQILFLLLDEALGEFGTQKRIGEIRFSPCENAIKLIALPDFLDKLWKEKEWNNLSPLETYSGYQSEPSDEFLRSDTISGFTCLPEVVFEYLNNDGFVNSNPVVGTGADLVFIELTQAGVEHCDDPLDYRSKIEDEVQAHLAGGGGVVTGAATGIENAYIDVLIFDGDRSKAAILDAVSKTHTKSFEIHPFVSDTQ